MPDILTALMHKLDRDLPGFAAEEVIGWPVGQLDQLVTAGIVVEGESATIANCPGCYQPQRVQALPHSTAGVAYYVVCPQCSPERIEPDSLRQYEICVQGILQPLSRALGLNRRAEIVWPDRLWRLGCKRFAGANCNFFFGRRLWRAEWPELAAAIGKRAVVFSTRAETQIELRQVVPLTEVASWSADQLQFDFGPLNARLDTSRPRPKLKPPRRASRTAAIEKLKAVLADHLRAARDHAFATRDATGEPQLLPRPSQQQLADQAGLPKWTVTRCFQDQGASELQFLWNLAVDLDRLMHCRA